METLQKKRKRVYGCGVLTQNRKKKSENWLTWAEHFPDMKVLVHQVQIGIAGRQTSL